MSLTPQLLAKYSQEGFLFFAEHFPIGEIKALPAELPGAFAEDSITLQFSECPARPQGKGRR